MRELLIRVILFVLLQVRIILLSHIGHGYEVSVAFIEHNAII